MKSSVLSSIIVIVFLLYGCSPSILKGFRKAGSDQITKTELYPVFTQTDSAYILNMQIDFKKKHFSGMLVIKQTDSITYRALLSSYFGMKIFDLEFGKESFKVNYCVDVLNKKQVINTLKNDFNNLFFFNLEDDNQATVYTSKENDSLKVYKIKAGKSKHYYLVNNELNELRRIEIPHFFSNLQYYFLQYDNDHFPSLIQIKHTNIGLKFQLDKIKQ